MGFSCESFIDYSYGDIAVEALHPIKRIQNGLTIIVSAIQKLLVKMRGMFKAWVPKIHEKDYTDCILQFTDLIQTAQKGVNDPNVIGEGLVNEMTETIDMIEKSQKFNTLMNIDGSTFGKDDYAEIDVKALTKLLNIGIKQISTLKRAMNIPDESRKEIAVRLGNAFIKMHTLVNRFIVKILKFHPPIKNPKNVNKLGGVGQATPQMG